MKILILHNTYQQRGGEDSVVEAESSLLRDAGHFVDVELVSNDSISGLSAKIRTFIRTPYDHDRKQWMADLLQRTQAEVVHIHNFFPLLTPAVHEAASERGVAVVQTMHNFRTVCASALLMRDEQVCEKCMAGNRNWALLHRCYRGSFAGSLALVRMQNRAFKTNTWEKHTDKIIALTQFGKDKFIEGGLPEKRLVVKPNFIADENFSPNDVRSGALFVGRLSLEKGADKLVEAWKSLPDIPLRIVGDGPERSQLESIAPAHVTFCGLLSREDVRKEMAHASALIMPSIWYEGFPMTIVEAFSTGLPVIASRLGSMAEIITHSENGLHFTAGDPHDLADTVRTAFLNPISLTKMGHGARQSYETYYTPEKNLQMLEGIYASAIREAKRKSD